MILLYCFLILLWLGYSVYLLIKGFRLSLERIQEAYRAYNKLKEARQSLKEILK
jgi:hypothetical protein